MWPPFLGPFLRYIISPYVSNVLGRYSFANGFLKGIGIFLAGIVSIDTYGENLTLRFARVLLCMAII